MSVLRRWGWVIGLVVVGVIVAFVTQGKIFPDLEEIKKTADAQSEAKKLQAKLGRDEAKKQIERQYAETIKELDDLQRQEAMALKDPGARARFYTRVAHRRTRAKT